MADVKRVEDEVEVDLTPKSKGLIRGKAKWDKEIFSCSYYIYTVLSHALNYSCWTNPLYRRSPFNLLIGHHPEANDNNIW